MLIEKNLKPKEAPIYQRYAKLMSWADERAQAAGPHQRRPAGPGRRASVAFGAEGIGLCRTEHMFFGEGKIDRCAR